MRIFSFLALIPFSLTNPTEPSPDYIPSLLQSHSLSPPHIFTRRVQPYFVPSTENPFQAHPPLRNPTPLSLSLGPIHSTERQPNQETSLLLAISTTPPILPFLLAFLPHYQHAPGVSILLALHGFNKTLATSTKHQLRHLDLDISIITTAETSDQGGRYAQLMQELMKQRVTGKWKWFGVLDGDIFISNLGQVTQYLKSQEGEVFVGIPSSESDWTTFKDQNESKKGANKVVTYGGGTVLMSTEALDLAGQLLCLQYTKTSGQDDERWNWDRGLFECLNRYTEVELRVLPGLYDPQTGTRRVYGDARPLVIRMGGDVNVEKGYLVTRACGEDCFLQRFVFADGWVLVNGHTLTYYPEGVEVREREKTVVAEMNNLVAGWITLERKEKAEDTMLVWKGRTKTWQLLDSRAWDNGEVWQVYVNKGGDVDHVDDSVVVLIWEPNLDLPGKITIVQWANT